jgi:hypothetical protein
MAHAYDDRFQNVWSGPQIVNHGEIASVSRGQTIKELCRLPGICIAGEMPGRPSALAELGTGEVIARFRAGKCPRDCRDGAFLPRGDAASGQSQNEHCVSKDQYADDPG